MRGRNFAAVLIVAAIVATEADAQSLSTVPSADVPPGEQLIDYRIGYSLSDDGRSDRIGQRVHFQRSLSDSVRLRLIILQGEREDGVLKTQNVIAHAHFQLVESERSGGWDSGIRFDGFIPVDRRPGRARVVFLNAVDVNRHWQIRGDIFVAREIGEMAERGFQLETREEVSYAASERTRIGAQFFNNWKATKRFQDFADQRHQLGVFVRTRVTQSLGVEMGWLFGLTDAAPDADVRLMLTYLL